jgi:transcriptional regulator with XRE-family HTH domain
MTVKRAGLARARKAAGHTQEQLAELMHVDRRTIARWECGFSEPMPYLRPKLGRLLRLTAEALEALLVEDLATAPPKVSSVPGSVVGVSQEEWRRVRRRLNHHRTELANKAVRLYEPDWRVANTATLAASQWIPPHPLPLEAVTYEWEPHPSRPKLTGEEAELRPVLPLRKPGHAFSRYTSAMRYLDPPKLFENRPTYRLLDVSGVESGQTRLRFGLTTFFDKLDVSEALGHEFAAVTHDGPLVWERLPFRSLLTTPFDLSLRAVGTGVATLTIRRNTVDGSATFFLLWRDPAQVAVAGGQYGVLPAGEFQPASIAPASITTDLDLWRNIVREYSEELLGQPEHDGSSGKPLDYDYWPFYRTMQQARESGQSRAYFLGVVLHALGLNAAVLTAVIIDDVVFDDMFENLVKGNTEGRVVGSFGNNKPVHGLPFTEETVNRLLLGEPIGGTSGACLALALRHSEHLLSNAT